MLVNLIFFFRFADVLNRRHGITWLRIHAIIGLFPVMRHSQVSDGYVDYRAKPGNDVNGEACPLLSKTHHRSTSVKKHPDA